MDLYDQKSSEVRFNLNKGREALAEMENAINLYGFNSKQRILLEKDI